MILRWYVNVANNLCSVILINTYILLKLCKTHIGSKLTMEKSMEFLVNVSTDVFDS